MRRDFVTWLEKTAAANPRLILLTGDLGFDAFERIQAEMGDRFINVGVSEQNMISVAAGLAHQGLEPLCYSIAPFAVFRAYEQIRLDVALHEMNVKIVGNGGGYGYGIMGASHHALEDLAVISVLPHFRCLVPFCNGDVAAAGEALMATGPAYLRLGFGAWPKQLGPLPLFAPVRRLAGGAPRPRLTLAGIGPIVLHLLAAAASRVDVDVFAVSQLPLPEEPEELWASLRASGRLLVAEEHSARGGLGEYLATGAARMGIPFRLVHHHAAGYPGGLYGSQAYHQKVSKLDASSLQAAVGEFLRPD